MFQDKYVFVQLVSFLNRSKFNRIVTKYHGDKYDFKIIPGERSFRCND